MLSTYLKAPQNTPKHYAILLTRTKYTKLKLEKKSLIYWEVKGKKNPAHLLHPDCVGVLDWQSAWASNPRLTLIQMSLSPDWCTHVCDITFFKLSPAPLQTSEKSTDGKKQQEQKMRKKQNYLCLRRTLLLTRKWLKKKGLKPFLKIRTCESCAVRLIILCKWLIYLIPFMRTSKRNN